MGNIIAAVIIWAFSLAFFVLSLLAFRRKGILLNNAWLYASGKDRETMDTAPYYRQSAVVFGLLGEVFLLNGFAALLEAAWLSHIATAVILITVLYAILSTAANEKRKKQEAP